MGLWVGALVAFAAQWSPGDVTQQDTTMPNRFEFTQAEYVVDENATNAVITVRFYPGNRAVAGSVAYTTEDVTAIAGEDYVGVSGNLWFSGWEPRCLTVPVIWVLALPISSSSIIPGPMSIWLVTSSALVSCSLNCRAR